MGEHSYQTMHILINRVIVNWLCIVDMEAPLKAKEKLKYLSEASKVFDSSLGTSFKKVKGN